MKQRKRGQGMTENIITIALIAIATIGIVTLFGGNVRKLFAASSDGLAGAASVSNPGARRNAALEKKNLTTFAAGGVGNGGASMNGPMR